MKQTGNIIYSLTLAVWLLLGVFVHASGAGDQMTTTDEYALKAVCLYNFTQFTRWPASVNLKLSESIVIGVLGDSPFGEAIKELQAQLKKTDRKNIQVVFHGSYQEGMDLTGSHMLFISASEKRNMRKILASLADAPVLTVSDVEGFLEEGGMISLVLLDNKIRWEVNRVTIHGAGLQVSSKLLQLALRVEDIDHTNLNRHRRNRKNHLLALFD